VANAAPYLIDEQTLRATLERLQTSQPFEDRQADAAA
jgi:hypothetical protein